MTRELTEVLDLHIPVSVVLAQKPMTLGQVLAIVPGSVLEFDKPVAGALELMLHDRKIAVGRAVRVGENFALQVTEVADPRSVVRDLARPQT